MSWVFDHFTNSATAPAQDQSLGASPSSDDHTTAPLAETRKRRREDDASNLPETFHILVQVVKVEDWRVKLICRQPCPHSHLDAPVKIVSVCLVSRARLPLSWLDSQNGQSLFSHSRFFSSSIPALEEASSNAFPASHGAAVLIVKSEGQEIFHAVERVRNGIYTSCRLGNWVKASQLERVAALSLRLATPFQIEDSLPNLPGKWWTAAAASSARLPQARSTKRARVEATRTQCPDDDGVNLPETPEPTNTSTRMPASDAETALGTQTVPQASPNDITTSIAVQYLETLYLSNASLAYFAKGPLSRARTYFSGSSDFGHLPNALRELVLTIAAADKRYKQTIPDVLKTQVSTGDAQAQLASPEASAKRSAKKRRKGVKRSKDGLLPCEPEYIAKWWLGDDIVESANSDLRTRLPELRFRETLLQLILILETLACEASLPESTTVPGVAEGLAQSIEAAVQPEPKTKVKKPKDLGNLAETLIDRLTIWQSIEAADDGKKAEKSAARSDFLVPTDAVDKSDRIRDFCTEVVMPFYGSRLPVLVTKLRQKMGLPNTPPARRRGDILKVSSVKAPKLAPGSALSRDDFAQQRKPFTRVSSDSTKPRLPKPPSLLRSATDSTLQNMKREGSTTPQIPFARGEASGNSRPVSRAGSIANDAKARGDRNRRSLSRTNSINQTMSNREVDTSIFTKFKEAKARKAAFVEEEIRGAIAKIKKPNRELALKDVVDEAEARSARMQKRGGLLQRKSHLNVQVNATPTRASKHSVLATPARASTTQPVETISSTNPFVPASTIKATRRDTQLASQPQGMVTTPSRPARIDHIHDHGTPLVPSTTPRSRMPQEPQSRARVDNPFRTPTKLLDIIPAFQTRTQPSAFAIPSTPASAAWLCADVTPEAVGTENQPQTLPREEHEPPRGDANAAASIYEALGWDDGMDDFM